MLLRLFSFLVFSNSWVSLSGAIMSAGLAHFIGAEEYVVFGTFVFGATLSVYSLQRIIRAKQVSTLKSDRHKWIEEHQWLLLSLFVLGLLIAAISYFLFLYSWKSLLLLSVFTSFSLLYAWRINKNGYSLRELPFVKIHLIAITWTIILVVWPLMHYGLAISDFLSLTFALYFYLLATTIPFDIRDLSYDATTQKTIPQIFGVNGAKVLALILLLLSGFLFYFTYSEIIFSPWLYILFFGNIAQVILTSPTRKELFFSGWIDGWYIVLGVLFYSL